MNVLIVHAHNEPQSFTRALCDQACETLAGQGHAVQVSDLYAMNWNPVASAADFAERADPDYLVYALEQRESVKRQSLAADIQAELDKLLWADLLILNFPIYWFSVPAILKGWFDRVLVSGVCYGGKRFYDQGGLAGKKALVSLTLGGRQHMFGEGAIHGPLEDMLRPILRGTLAYVGMQVLEPSSPGTCHTSARKRAATSCAPTGRGWKISSRMYPCGSRGWSSSTRCSSRWRADPGDARQASQAKTPPTGGVFARASTAGAACSVTARRRPWPGPAGGSPCPDRNPASGRR